MERHEQRVVDEKAQLSDRLTKLNEFIQSDRFSALSIDERDLLLDQSLVMAKYLTILRKRVALFDRKNKSGASHG